MRGEGLAQLFRHAMNYRKILYRSRMIRVPRYIFQRLHGFYLVVAVRNVTVHAVAQVGRLGRPLSQTMPALLVPVKKLEDVRAVNPD